MLHPEDTSSPPPLKTKILLLPPILLFIDQGVKLGTRTVGCQARMLPPELYCHQGRIVHDRETFCQQVLKDLKRFSALIALSKGSR